MIHTFSVYNKKMLGPYKLQGYQGHRNVSKCSPHHNGDICITRGNNLKNSFSYMSQNVKTNIYFWLFRPNKIIPLFPVTLVCRIG